MGLEAIGSALSSVATSIGKAGGGIATEATGAASVSGTAISAPTFEAAPAVGSLEAMFGPVMGPVGGTLEGFEDMGKSDLGTLDLRGGSYQPNFDLGGEILFKARPQASEAVPAEPETITSLENFLAQARTEPQKEQNFASDEPEIISQATNWLTDTTDPVIKPAEVIMPQVESIAAPFIAPDIWENPLPEVAVSPALKPAAAEQPKAEYKDSAEQAQAISVQPALQEEGAKMEEITEEQTQTGSKEAWEEEEARERKIIVEDSEVAAQRRVDIKEASKKAAAEAQLLGLKKIPSFLIAKFMPKEYKGVRSQVVKEAGPDGSYQETVEEIAASGEFESETAATEYSNKVAESKKPAKWAKEGTPLAFEHVARIFKYGIVKPMQAHIEVIKRVVKKKMEVPGQNSALMQAKEPVKAESEHTLKDLGIAEVFVKAA